MHQAVRKFSERESFFTLESFGDHFFGEQWTHSEVFADISEKLDEVDVFVELVIVEDLKFLELEVRYLRLGKVVFGVVIDEGVCDVVVG